MRSGLKLSPRAVGVLAAGLAAGLLAGGLYVLNNDPVVAPKTWAKSVCSALAPWRTQVASLTTAAQQQLGRTGTPDQTKQALTTLLSGAESASERARTRVVSAGIPDVDGGKGASAQFVTALVRARDAYGHARRAISGLATGPAKQFYDSVAEAFTALNEEYRASALDIGKVGPAALRRSFDEVPECQ